MKLWKLIFWFFTLFTSMGLASNPPAFRNWTLRFKTTQGFRAVTPGCMGTASYAYARPELEAVLKYQKALYEKLKDLNASVYTVWARTGNKFTMGEMKVVNLEDGTVRDPKNSQLGPWPDPSEQHLILCPCRNYYKNCGNLRDYPEPLGVPFSATPNEE